jgi:hypothetical protein
MKENPGIIVNKENNTVTCTAPSSQFGIRRGGPCGCVVPKELEFEAESQKWEKVALLTQWQIPFKQHDLFLYSAKQCQRRQRLYYRGCGVVPITFYFLLDLILAALLP